MDGFESQSRCCAFRDDDIRVVLLAADERAKRDSGSMASGYDDPRVFSRREIRKDARGSGGVMKLLDAIAEQREPPFDVLVETAGPDSFVIW